ncbi:hypothetical protein NDU88_003423, partial [Pleurodeles waltl]
PYSGVSGLPRRMAALTVLTSMVAPVNDRTRALWSMRRASEHCPALCRRAGSPQHRPGEMSREWCSDECP